MRYCNILGTNINVTEMHRTLTYLTQHIEELRGEYICISNVHTTVMAYYDEFYRNVQNSAAMALPDGKPLSLVSRGRGYLEANRVPGPDLMPEVFEMSAAKGYRHYFYGGKEDTLKKLESNLLERYPDLNIVGMYSPPFRPLTEEEDIKIIEKINASRPDFIWVALGAPKQEKWMYEHKGKLYGVMVGVGAAFDFLAGTVRRAPKWMQEMCLEWFFRILQEPGRLISRYVKTNADFLWLVHKENKKIKKNRLFEKERLRIAMIGHKRIPSREGGVEIVVNELSVRMAAKGHQVEAYNRKGSHVSGKEFVNRIGKKYKGINIITIPTFENKNLNAIVYSFMASVRALFTSYDVVHYHAEGPCATLWIPKLFHKRVVVTIHGLDWQRSKWGNFATRVLKFGERMAAKYADEIIVLSANMQEYFMREYGRKTVFIPNGVNRPEKTEAAEIKEKWNIDEDEYILFLARIVPEKGAHYLIDAYKRAALPKKLVIAGGSSHSGEYYEDLKIMAGENKNIIFTNFVGGRELEELYSNAYFFVLPSDVEGMAMGLLEAMSYGNCCLVSDIPENLEVTGDYAVQFRHSDVRDLMEKIETLVLHPEIVEKYKSRAADYICKKYDWDIVVDETLEVYRGKTREDING